jgi:hypothetical protein
MNNLKQKKLQEESYLRLIEAAANQGKFNPEELKSAKDVLALAKHYKGIAEIVTATYLEGDEDK